MYQRFAGDKFVDKPTGAWPTGMFDGGLMIDIHNKTAHIKSGEIWYPLNSTGSAAAAGVNSIFGLNGTVDMIGTGGNVITSNGNTIIVSGGPWAREVIAGFPNPHTGVSVAANRMSLGTGLVNTYYGFYNYTPSATIIGHDSSSNNYYLIQTSSSQGAKFQSFDGASYQNILIDAAHLKLNSSSNGVISLHSTGRVTHNGTPIVISGEASLLSATGSVGILFPNLQPTGTVFITRDGSSRIIISGSGDGGEVNTASNLGVGTGIYSAKVGVDLRFKSIVPGENIYITGDSDQLTVSATGYFYSGQQTFVQYISNNQTGSASTTSVLPIDNTIPQSSEGSQFASLTITPKSANNNICIHAGATVGASASIGIVFAIFKDSETDARAATAAGATTAAGGSRWLDIKYDYTTTGTGPVTFKWFYGPGSAGTAYIGRTQASILFGGSGVSYFDATETRIL